jgi:enoyl-CoA hydratase
LSVTSVTTVRGESWALISLRSPAGLNKLGTGTLVPLLEEIKASLSQGLRCLGLTGEGGSFAVGADLKEIGGLTPATAREFSDLGNTIFRLLENADTMIVAGIDGFCLGGGLDLALAADWRIATARSVFGHPGADLGLITGFGGTQRLPRLIGVSRAVNWLCTAGRFSASDARMAGLIQEMTTEDDFKEILMNRIRGFNALSPEWIRDVKRGFRGYGGRWPESGGACACL